MTEEEQLAAEFETHRPYLHAIAFRVLGSHADADDAVQEAWLRLARTGGGGIEDLRGWLTTVTGRICLDALRRRGVRGEQPLELAIEVLPREGAGNSRIAPEEEILLADSVALALYVVMDALTPAERVSFVLHDVFEFPFDAIAAVLGRSTAATKMLASRARGRIRLSAPKTDAATRDVVDAMAEDSGLALDVLRVDGGITANELCMQLQADICGVPVVRPVVAETTALGAAYAAGLATGFWSNTDELKANWNESKRWNPEWNEQQREDGYAGWKKAVQRTLNWVEVD